jgi:hypothetical protein
MQIVGRGILFLAIFIIVRYLRIFLFKNSKMSRWQVAFVYSFLWGGSFLLAVILFLEPSYIFPFGILLFALNFLTALPIAYFVYPAFHRIGNKNNS